MLPKIIRILLLLCLLLCPSDAYYLRKVRPGYLKIAAFNIQTLGPSKIAHTTIRKNIVKIISRYDIVFVQEIRDSSLKAVNKLLSSLQDEDGSWSYVSSDPTGRHSYKEQYAFFYKKNSATVMASYQIPDASDIYERDPYCVKVKYYSKSKSKNRYVILAGVHIKPEDAKNELEKVDETMKELDLHWPRTDGVIMMGDFNADCDYLAGIHRNTITIFNSPAFKSLIEHDVDTTVRDTDCAYDRIIVYGDEIDAKYAKVYNFKKALHLNQSAAEDVSDHFPVEFRLY